MLGWLRLVVRVRLRIRTVDGRSAECVAILNSGFAAPTPQLIIHVDVAERLGLKPEEGVVVELETAGGPAKALFYPRKAFVKVVAGDAESKEVLVDIIVLPTVREALVSDMLIDELEIAIESFSKGLWRFRWEPQGKLRRSEEQGTL